MNTTTVAQLLKTAGQILDDLQSLIVRSCPPKGRPDRLRVGLVLTIAEQFEATLRLANAHMSTHSATHVRSMIEALVAMKMLESDVGYVDPALDVELGYCPAWRFTAGGVIPIANDPVTGNHHE